MAGLLAPTLPETKIKPLAPEGTFTEATAKPYTPSLGTVNLDTDSVSGQLDKLLSSDSPYITRARSSAAGAANSRGLLNSSFGVQAGEAAAIDAALPIASQDANTFSTQRLTNQAAENAAGQFNAAAENQAGIVNAAAANQLTQQRIAGEQQIGAIGAQGEQVRKTEAQQFGSQTALLAQRGEIDKQLQTADAATRANLLSQQAAIDTQMQNLRAQQIADLTRQQAGDTTELQALKGAQAQALADTEAAYKSILQTSASASQLFSNMMVQMTNILGSTETSAEGKAAALRAQRDLFESGIAAIGTIGDVDVSATVDFSQG